MSEAPMISNEDLQDDSQELDDSESYIDFGMIGKGFFLLGVVGLLAYLFLTIIARASSSSSHWESMFFLSRGFNPQIFLVTVFLMIIGGFFYFIHLQFLKLAEFDEEIESDNL